MIVSNQDTVLARVTPEPTVPTPPPYDGDPKACRPFLSQCAITFTLQPTTFATEAAKVAFVITLLTGKAREWGTTVREKQAPYCATFELEMIKVFDCSVAEVVTAQQEDPKFRYLAPFCLQMTCRVQQPGISYKMGCSYGNGCPIVKSAGVKVNDNKVSQIEQVVRLVQGKCDQAEIYSRRWNLRLTSLKEKDGEDIRNRVLEILKILTPDEADDIRFYADTIHRVGRLGAGNIRPRPVIIQFAL
ncbi:Pol poly [Labeo rohita]|uniref:Pol poly n=1 Tax=Labeo rohita TaxID=84645 RepID=A0A498MJY2_LABRO|nr:Pol poly [Labeo rohita]